MAPATLVINSRNYGAWSLRGWLLCRWSGIDFVEEVVPADDPSTRAELLALSPSFLVPRLTDGPVEVWNTLAIAEYLHEKHPEAGLLPADPVARARCRSVAGEMHGGFANLRSALPMNVKARHSSFKVWSGARADIDRVRAIWDECLIESGGPYLFGDHLTVADAMFAPVCTRFRTYSVPLEGAASAYCQAILDLDDLVEWCRHAEAEEEVTELEIEF